MAKKSPSPYHAHWGQVASPAELPNVAAATIQDTGVERGDFAYSLSDDELYVCKTETVGAGVWVGTVAGVADLKDAYDGGESVGLTDARGAIKVVDFAQTAPTPAIQITKGIVLGGAIIVDDFVGGISSPTLGSSDGSVGQNPSRNLRIQTGAGGTGSGSGGGASGGITIAAGEGGDEAAGFAAGVGGPLSLKAGDGGPGTGLGNGADGGLASLRAGDAGWPGFGNAGLAGDLELDAGADPSGNNTGGDITLGGTDAKTITSGNFPNTGNIGTPWTQRGRMLIQGPGSLDPVANSGLTIQPQQSDLEGTVNVSRMAEFDDAVSALGGSPVILLVDNDPDGQVTSGDPGSLAIDPNTSLVYKKLANPSAWAVFGVPLTIREEGALVSSETASIDFVGAELTATNVGDAVTVTFASVPKAIRSEAVAFTINSADHDTVIRYTGVAAVAATFDASPEGQYGTIVLTGIGGEVTITAGTASVQAEKGSTLVSLIPASGESVTISYLYLTSTLVTVVGGLV